MRFSKPLLKLPIRFSADALAAEVAALPKSAWTAHPQRFQGNSAVRLITAHGRPTDAIQGEMAPTPYLADCPYIGQIMAEIGSVWGRSRLMALAPGAEVPAHIDSHYYWRTHIRIHIPVVTNPGVSFTCGEETVHMEAGECWVFDSFLRHEVHNRGSETRVHLVLDTVGGGQLSELIETAESGVEHPRLVEPAPSASQELAFERVNLPTIMSPWEIRCHVDFIMSWAQQHAMLDGASKRIGRFIQDWTALWAQFGPDPRAAARYFETLSLARQDLLSLGADQIPLTNGVSLQHIFDRLIGECAVQPAMQAAQPQMSSGLRRVS